MITGLSINERDQLVTFSKLRDGEITQTAAAKMLSYGNAWRHVNRAFKWYKQHSCREQINKTAQKAASQSCHFNIY